MVDEPAQNTDRELYREDTGDLAGSHYESSVFVTEHGSIGMNVGGRCVAMPIEKWHALAWPADPVPAADPVLRQQLREALDVSIGTLNTEASIQAVLPIVEAWGDARVAAARSETAEQINAERAALRSDEITSNEYQAGKYDGLLIAAALVSGKSGPAREGSLHSHEDLAAIIVGRIKTGFGRQVGDGEARRIGEWVVNGYPWDGLGDDVARSVPGMTEGDGQR